MRIVSRVTHGPRLQKQAGDNHHTHVKAMEELQWFNHLPRIIPKSHSLAEVTLAMAVDGRGYFKEEFQSVQRMAIVIQQCSPDM